MATWKITPNPKVRMTRRDTWANENVRPAVQKWRLFATQVKHLGVTVEDGDALTFVIPMPESWSAKKKAAHAGKPHRSKPDLDNLIGGLFDAAMPGGDQHVAELGPCLKMWGYEGEIWVSRKNLQPSP